MRSGIFKTNKPLIASQLLLLSTVGITAVASASNQEKQTKKGNEKPNIVLIVADDFGYGDLSCYGATKITSPQIDKLASEGVRFTDAYVASSLCSPSRYSLMTGRYSWRTHLKSGVLKSFAPPLIEEGRTTLASMLKKNGYSTACIGKWHLGFNWALKNNAPKDAAISVFESWGTEPQQYIDFSKPVKGGPVERGFDYFYGISGANNMMPFVYIENDKVLEVPSIPNNFGTKTLRAPNWDLKYLDQNFTKKAVEVIDHHFNKKEINPLFLYFPTSAIHRPCLPTFTKGKSQAGMRGDMILEFDWMVGEIVKSLKKYNALDNTLIIITSDNGPQPGDPYALVQKFKNKALGKEYDYYQSYFGDYKPEYLGNGEQDKGWLVYGHNPTAGLFGFKADGWEGGLRVPFIARWPKKIKGGAVNSNIICLVDIIATIAELTGEKLQENEGEDSYSFLQNLLDNNSPEVRNSLTLVSGRTGALVVRKGDWKYLEGADPKNFDQTQSPNSYSEIPNYLLPQLYNLREDLYEKNNKYEKLPGKVSELREILELVKKQSKTESNK